MATGHPPIPAPRRIKAASPESPDKTSDFLLPPLSLPAERSPEEPWPENATLLKEIEQELRLGLFIPYDHMFDFTRHLDQIEGKLQALLAAGEAERAIRLYEVFLNSKKSKYYSSALAHFEKVRNLYLMIGAEAHWRTLVTTIREKHSRKHGFMPGFERIVAGGSLHGPSFLERAQKRWQKQTGGEDP